MKKSLKNTLFDKKRFTWMKKQRTTELRKMSLCKAAKLQKDLLLFYTNPQRSSNSDNPVSYRILLRNK